MYKCRLSLYPPVCGCSVTKIAQKMRLGSPSGGPQPASQGLVYLLRVKTVDGFYEIRVLHRIVHTFSIPYKKTLQFAGSQRSLAHFKFTLWSIEV